MPLQDFIHKLEVGGGMRYLRMVAAILGLLGVVVLYNWRTFRNEYTQEAMDFSQVARSVSGGQGYTTRLIRPFSVYLITERNKFVGRKPETNKVADLGMVRGDHPDIANPPLYPVALAGWMKLMPFRYPVDEKRPFWSTPKNRMTDQGGRQFWRYQPDFLIGVFNQTLFLATVVLLFFLARRLFDSGVAWVSTILLLGNELLWRFALSGLSTTLLLLIFVGLFWCVTMLEREIREPQWKAGGANGLALLAGLLVGLGSLTRYSFGFLIIPLLTFVIIIGGQRRFLFSVLIFAAFSVVVLPWMWRNYQLSGFPFGTTTFAIFEGASYSEYHLQRSMAPDIHLSLLSAFWQKLLPNLRLILQNDLPKLGGSWICAFFLVGLLIGFRQQPLRRLRYFLLMCLLTVCVVQALGRTQITEDYPDINTENLLVLLFPLVSIYAVSLFFILLDQLAPTILSLRYLVIGAFAVLVCLPMILVFLPPKTIPVVYPPFYPPVIQKLASWVKPTELTMSDIPAAMAWYGRRKCVWVTLRAMPDRKDPDWQEGFVAFSDWQVPVVLLYLSPVTMDSRFLSQWLRSGEKGWGSFILESMLRKETPPSFPLRKAPAGWLPEQFVLTDWERWAPAARRAHGLEVSSDTP